jgi:hypothetical protein
MHHLILALLLCLNPSPGAAHGLEPACDPALATVRITSHGASATIIATSPGRSWLLGCAHMFLGPDDRPDPGLLQGPFRIDGPVQPYARAGAAAVRLLDCDFALDLSLLEIDSGPFHHVPVAEKGHKPSRRLRSLGYDEMNWPVTNRPATIVAAEGDTTFTAERPWHGRSGGGLIDIKHRCLIGVVQGYEIWPTRRGLYVSHAAILRFLAKHRRAQPRTPAAAAPVPVQSFSHLPQVLPPRVSSKRG